MDFVCGANSADAARFLLEKSQAEAFAELVSAVPRGRSLDLETGSGDFAGIASSLGFSALGASLRENELMEAKRRFPGAAFTALNSRKLPTQWRNEFTLVSLMNGGFSRFDDAGKKRVLRGAGRVLKSGGFLLVSEWNKCGGFPYCGRDNADWRKCGCASELTDLLERDFEVKRVVTCDGCRMYAVLAEKQ